MKRYGSPKITKVLASKGMFVSQKRVAKRMKSLGIKSIVIGKRKPCSYYKCDNSKSYPNLLNQDFSASAPSQKWVGDITYIYTTNNGWTYLAIVMDLFDLSVIGYSYGKKMNSQLVVDAFKMAVAKRGISNNLIFHSDRGSQYTSNDFESLLSSLDIRHSFSKKGCPYDNASMESFNSIIKKELVYTMNFYSIDHAFPFIFDFIESWYNNIRIHSSLNYLTPNRFFIITNSL